MKYTVKKGDTLTIIARDVLGNMALWQQIALLNGLRSPYVIQPGQVLQLPDVRQPGGALVSTGSGSFDDPRVFSQGTTVTAEVPPDARAPMSPWVRYGFWGALLLGVSYFLFPPQSSLPSARRKRRR